MHRLTSPFFCFFTFFFLSLSLDAQVVDTAAVRREVDSLRILTINYANIQKFERAFEINDLAIQRTKRVWSDESIPYTEVLLLRGWLFLTKGEYLNAEEVCLKVKKIIDDNNIIKSKNYSKCLDYLAGIYMKLGQYIEAEKYCLESLNLTKQIMGKNNELYAGTLNWLGILYKNIGRYSDAESIYI